MLLRFTLPILVPIAMALPGCAPSPGIVTLDQPIASPAYRVLLDPSRYSQVTRDVLRQEGLTDSRSASLETIRALIQRLEGRESVEIRTAAAEIALKTAYRWQNRDLNAALGMGLTSLELAQVAPALPESASREKLLTIYNEASGAFASFFHDTFDDSGNPAELTGATRSYRVRWSPGAMGSAKASYYDTIRPSSFLKIRGFDARYQRGGVGGAVVGYRRPNPARIAADPSMSLVGYAVALTSVVRIDATGQAEISLYDLAETEEARVSGKRHPLTADFTAPLATLAESAPSKTVGFKGMLKPDDYASSEGLYLIAPYRPGRIPLILVHGLMSSPATWREIFAACYADPFLRRHYQVLVFYYPTGYPIPRNAARLRAELREFKQHYDPKGTDAQLRQIVMIGHSMGSLLTNFQIRPGGDPVWNKLFTKPIDQISMSADEREKLEAMIYFQANPDIKRVVFICGPHRGSEFANHQIGRFGSRLIKLPVQLFDQVSTPLQGSTTEFGRDFLTKPRNSIDNLRVNSPVLTTILERPLTYNPPYHSIIGDRGKGDSPNSTDGVVPYWSSHLDGAASEKIVSSDHNATNDPETVEEVRRILYLHLGRTYKP